MKCDVLVVGAGPAGLASAITTTKKGLKTILIEKSSEIGYPVKTSAYTFKEVIDDWDLSEKVMSQWCNAFYVNSLHSNREIEVKFKKDIGGYLNYPKFLAELSFKAIKNGTKILLSESASEPILDGDIVKGIMTKNNKEIHSKIVIDCSGPNATIGRKLNLLPKKEETEIGIGIEYEMSNVKVRNPKSIDFFVGQKEIVPIGYGWIFPLGADRARIGICTVYNTLEILEEKNIKYWHERFLGKKSPIYPIVKNAQPYAIHSGAYPLSGMLEKPYANGLLLAGDSAAQASMLVGEGIRYALEFGKSAGITAIESFKSNDFSEDILKSYVDKCYDYLGEYFDVAIDLLQVPTDEYWEGLIDAMINFKDTNPENILKYLKTEMTKQDAKNIFPSFVGKYLSQ